MSLILDALRKLEREKGSYEPGVLVVGSVPWGAGSRSGVLLAGGSGGNPRARGARGLVAAPQPDGGPATRVSRRRSSSRPLPSCPARSAVSLTSPRPRRPCREQLRSRPRSGSATHPPSSPRMPQQTRPRHGAVRAGSRGHRAVSTPAPELRLSAISQRDGKPMALINDRLVFEGDSFDGIRVIRIGDAEVELEVKGERCVLRF